MTKIDWNRVRSRDNPKRGKTPRVIVPNVAIEQAAAEKRARRAAVRLRTWTGSTS